MKVPSTYNIDVAALTDAELAAEKKSLSRSALMDMVKETGSQFGSTALGLTTVFSLAACFGTGAFLPGLVAAAAAVGTALLGGQVEEFEEDGKYHKKRLNEVRDEINLRDPDTVRAALEPDKRTEWEKAHDREVGITAPFGPDPFTVKAKTIFGGVNAVQALLEVDGLSNGVGENPFTIEHFNEISAKRRAEAQATRAASPVPAPASVPAAMRL